MSETPSAVDKSRSDVISRDESRVGDRRSFMTVAALVGITATATAPARAMPPKSDPQKVGCILGENDRASLDRLAVAELVQRERAARDQGIWDEMAACYHPESRIETAWFKGTGAEFVARTSRMLGDGKIVSLRDYPSRGFMASWVGSSTAKQLLPVAKTGGCCGSTDCC